MQLAGETDPVAARNVPAAHGVHVEAPVALAKLPAAQAEHETPSPEKPALQAHWEVSAVEPAAQPETAVALPLQVLQAVHVRPLP